MTEFALGVTTLVWWSWPAIVVCVFVSMTIAYRVEERRSRRLQADRGPVQCAAFVAESQGGFIQWCHREAGHMGGHQDAYGLSAGSYVNGR